MRLSLVIILLPFLLTFGALSPPSAAGQGRDRLNIDRDWAFAHGHADDPARDFGHGTSAFFFAKAGYGDGPASAKYDDRAWRRVDLPHDWAVELPLDSRANTNHGSRAVGPGFPQNNVGWYIKIIAIPESDRGRRITVEFDGVYRDSVVWFNGHYIGNEHSGYSSFRYDLTDYVNYGAQNVLVVRVDASVEEGWFYEGAGIYRHTWLTKTDPLHVGHWGTHLTTEMDGNSAAVTVRTTVDNEDGKARAFVIDEEVLDAEGRRVGAARGGRRVLGPGQSAEFASRLIVPNARLWSVEVPVMHRLVTTIREGGVVVDRYETPFGVRTVRFDPDTGFWLNGKNVKLKGTNNHQDHAGVGVALPDALQEYRLRRLKAMGSNAYRTAHNPPTPELLDAADRLGILVIDEHRMMGTTPEIRDQLTRLIRRDRNHPSVILWSVGNEEWAIEGNETGARLTKLMQDQVRSLDPSRRASVAISSNAGRGSSTTADVIGFNYRSQHDVDAYHRAYPNTPAVMTEEGSTFATRGVYVTDPGAVRVAAYDAPQRPTGSSSIEQGWKAVAERPWMAGMFVWTGFDYRGETTPFGWPAISSQFGMLDTTGRFKDSAYFLKSWWSVEPMVHILPHWTWPDRAGQLIPVWVYSNAEEVELRLNGRSLGRKRMARNSHLEWQVAYAPGRLAAVGYARGREVASDEVVTAGDPQAVRLEADRTQIEADGSDVSIVTVSVHDRDGNLAPRANNLVSFEVTGPARIIGVGNGDPGSHENDRHTDAYHISHVAGWNVADLDGGVRNLGDLDMDTLRWRDPFRWYPPGSEPPPPVAFLARGTFKTYEAVDADAVVTLFTMPLDIDQSVYVNDVDVTERARTAGRGAVIVLPGSLVRLGANEVKVLVRGKAETVLRRMNELGAQNIGSVQIRHPAGGWKRRVFNGYAQVLLQSTGTPGLVTLTATGEGLRQTRLDLQTIRRPTDRE